MSIILDKKTYIKKTKLGEGAFGSVYEAVNVSNYNDKVAIKKYHLGSDDDIPYQILREVNIAKLLKHPNIIDFYTLIDTNQSIELVMAFGGMSLRTYYKKTPFIKRVNDIPQIASQIFAGCLYMHKLKVLHRDFKPENILITESGNNLQVKICDFGLAKKSPPIHGNLNSYQICTLWYRPPELFTENVQNYDQSIDIWSIGCILYEFILDRVLFEGSHETTVLKKILSRIPVTQSILDKLLLDHIKLESCNTETYYKLPPLYNLTISDKNVIDTLDSMKDLVQSMLIIDPSQRITIEKAVSHEFFKDHKFESQKSLMKQLDINRVRYHQDFYVRTRLSRQSAIQREKALKLIFDKTKEFSLNEQTALIAINTFDRFIQTKENSKHKLKPFVVVCLILASKYIDLKPLSIEEFPKIDRETFIACERKVAQVCSYDLNQPTLLNFYNELVHDGKIISGDILSPRSEHWKIITDIISDYVLLQDRGIIELKELLLMYINAN